MVGGEKCGLGYCPAAGFSRPVTKGFEHCLVRVGLRSLGTH